MRLFGCIGHTSRNSDGLEQIETATTITSNVYLAHTEVMYDFNSPLFVKHAGDLYRLKLFSFIQAIYIWSSKRVLFNPTSLISPLLCQTLAPYPTVYLLGLYTLPHFYMFGLYNNIQVFRKFCLTCEVLSTTYFIAYRFLTALYDWSWG